MDRQTGGWKNEQRDGQEHGHAKLNKLSSKMLKRPTLPRASQLSYKVSNPPLFQKKCTQRTMRAGAGWLLEWASHSGLQAGSS